MSAERKFVEREVRADDPDLSPEASRLLTEELQRAVGRERPELRLGSPPPPERRQSRRHQRRSHHE